LLGPVSSIGTVGGHTVYKCFVFLTTIGAIWAILAGTRLLRGEHSSGRRQLVVAGDARAAGHGRHAGRPRHRHGRPT